MKITKMFGFMTTLGLWCLCAVSAITIIRIRDDLTEIKRIQKKTNKQLTELKPKVERTNNSGFTTAFRLKMDEPELIEEMPFDRPEYSTLREYNGVIGVFDDEEELVREIGTAVSSLSAADRQSLLLGIKASSEDEIESIIGSFK